MNPQSKKNSETINYCFLSELTELATLTSLRCLSKHNAKFWNAIQSYKHITYERTYTHHTPIYGYET